MLLYLPTDIYSEAVKTGLERSAGKKHRDEGDAWAANSPDSDTRHIFGATCEFAIAHLFGVEPNREIYRKGDSNAPDLVLPSGRTVEIKGSNRQGVGFCLRTNNAEEFKADIGILVYSTPTSQQTLLVGGWITRPRFMDLSKEVSFGLKYGGKKLLVDAILLAPLVQLIHEEGDATGKEEEFWERAALRPQYNEQPN